MFTGFNISFSNTASLKCVILIATLNSTALSLQEQLSRHLEELKAEEARTEAHLQSLKKRKTNLSVSASSF